MKHRLSSVQQAIWFDQMLHRGSPLYNMGGYVAVKGTVDPQLLRKAIGKVISENDGLRILVTEQDGVPFLEFTDMQAELEYLDFSGAGAGECHRWMSQDFEKPLPIAENVWYSFALLKAEENLYFWYIKMHHLVADGWSVALLIDRVTECYTELSTRVERPRKSFSYLDFIEEDARYPLSEAYRQDEDFWLDRFVGFEAPTGIASLCNSFEKRGSAQRSIKKSMPVGKVLNRQIEALASVSGASPFHFFLALLYIYFSRISGRKDLVIGIPVLNRGKATYKQTIGLFVGVSPLRIRFDRDVTFTEVLSFVRNELRACFKHQRYPIDDLRRKIAARGEQGDLFEISLSYDKQSYSRPFNGFETYSATLTHNHGKAPLDVYVRRYDDEEEVSLEFEFNQGSWDSWSIHSFLQHIPVLMQDALRKPDLPISLLDILPEDERAGLLSCGTYLPDKVADGTVVQLIRKTASLYPDRPAIVDGKTTITYRELDQQSGRIASYLLHRYRLRPEDRIALMYERSAALIICQLSVLKASAAYVPVDPGYPADRIAYMIEDSACRVILCDRKPESSSGKTLFPPVETWEELLHHAASFPYDAIPVEPAPHNLAYIIYTSGTTGRPNGVMIEHRSLVNLCAWHNRTFDVSSSGRATLYAGIGFDASVWETWPYLVAGASLYPVREELRLDLPLLSGFLTDNGITHAFLPTKMCEQLVGSGFFSKDLLLLTGGEELIHRDFSGLRVVNNYGPTECTVVASSYMLTEHVSGRVPIGSPIDNTVFYILDSALQPLPQGIPGELYIGGAGLARGYTGNPELSSRKFIPNPFREGERIYRTGDRVCMRPDGLLEFRGRVDRQVKIRGYRIETSEIEAVLLEHPGVKQAVVTDYGKEEGHRGLLAYVVTTGSTLIQELREHLSALLPSYMVPSHIFSVPNIPLTLNGKIDTKSLPLPDTDSASGSGTDPFTKKEILLAGVWTSVLRSGRVSREANFFSLGGDSIKAIQICSRLLQQGYRLEMKDVFQFPVLADLAPRLCKPGRAYDQASVIGEVKLLPVQKMLFEKGGGEEYHFNQSILLEPRMPISREELFEALSTLTGHHDALRMSYRKEGGRVVQENRGTELKPYVEEHDLRNFSYQESIDLLEEKSNYLQCSFNLENGPLVKAALFRMKKGDRVLLVIHHLAVDGVSWRILLEDLSILMGQLKSGQPLRLPLKTASFREWSDALYQLASDSVFVAGQYDYWSRLAASSEQLSLYASPAGSNREGDARRQRVILTPELTTLLLTEAREAFSTEINDLLLSALALAIRTVFGCDKALIALEGHGREDTGSGIDLSRTTGWFTSVFPVLLEAREDRGLHIRETKEMLRRVPLKGLGYGILKYITDKSLLPGSLTGSDPALSFNYLGDFDAFFSESAFQWAEEPSGNRISPRMERFFDIDITCMVRSGRLEAEIAYNPSACAQETITLLAQSFLRELEETVTYCISCPRRVLTPSDLTYSLLSMEQLEALADPAAIEDLYPLSPMQEGMLFHSNYGDTSAYHEYLGCRFHQPLNPALVEQGFNELVRRHGALRTSFVHEQLDQPLQVVYRERAIDFRVQDISDKGKEEQERWLSAFRDTFRQQRFDLTSGALLRVALVRIGEEECELICCYHHILMDGWCISLLMKEFLELYRGFAQGVPARLSPVQPYSRYIAWLQARNKENAREYWRSYLEGYEEQSWLPFRKTAKDKAYDPCQRGFALSESTSSALYSLCRKLGVTESTVLQALWGVLLSRYNNSRDAVFGTVVSGRPAGVEGVETMTGLFINTLPLRVQYGLDTTLSELLQNLQSSLLDARPHEYLSLAEIQNFTPLRQSLVDHLFIFENYPVPEEMKPLLEESPEEREIMGFRISDLRVVEQTNYDLTVVVLPGRQFTLRMDFNRSVYEEQDILRVLDHYAALLDEAVRNVSASVDSLGIITEAEKTHLLSSFSTGPAACEPDKSIPELFTAQVRLHPHRDAVVYGERSITYSQLEEESSRIASVLVRQLGLLPGEPVALLIERGADMIVCILAVLKAGGAYLPLDPAHPVDRNLFVLADSGARLVLVSDTTAGGFQSHSFTGVVFNPFAKKEAPEEPFVSPATPSGLAYILYTSGSTGVPKGVEIEHRAVVNLVQGLEKEIYRDKGSHLHVALVASFVFDASVQQIFASLLLGHTLHIASEEEKRSGEGLAAFYSSHRIHVSDGTPVHTSLLLEVPHLLPALSLQHLVIGGDVLPIEAARRLLSCWSSPDDRPLLTNIYGPTECCVDVSCFTVSGLHQLEDLQSLPIGRPMSGRIIYILAGNMQLLPAGAWGEVWIGGQGLARGYRNREELTSTVFCDNPFGEGRLYRTGDIGRWTSGGEIEFRGRRDGQVKIRGYRIETGEIEGRLSAHPSLKEALVMAREDKESEKYLCAYYTSNEQPEPSELRDFLARDLPGYMIPAYFMKLDKFPLTSSAKIDRKALPDPRISLLQRTGAEEPRDEMQAQLADIWQEVLGIPVTGTEDNFFELGGHSLKATQVVSRIHRLMGYRLKLSSLFENPTLSKLSAHIRQLSRSASTVIPPAPVQEYYNLSYPQKRLWILSRFRKGSQAYNMAGALVFRKNIDRSALKCSFDVLLERHESFRTRFAEVQGEVYQQVLPLTEVHFSIPEINLEGDPEQESKLKYLTHEEISTPFDLGSAPLLRAKLVLLGKNEGVLLVSMHHIISDGWSCNILEQELRVLYGAYARGEEPSLSPPSPVRYRDFACWQNTKDFSREEAFWLGELSGGEELMRLPYDFPVAEQSFFKGAAIAEELDAETVRQLRESAVQNDTTLSSVVLSVFNIFLSQVTGQQRVTVGMAAASRNHPDLENIIGFFVNTLVIRTSLSEDMDFNGLVREVSSKMRLAQEHQDYPFDLLVEKLNPERQLHAQSLFNVMYGFQNFEDVRVQAASGHSSQALPDFEIDRSLAFETSKFDLTLFVFERGERLTLQFEYNSSLFRADTMQELLQTLVKFMQMAVSGQAELTE